MTGRQGLVFQGFNNIHNSMLTLSWYRQFFAFWPMKRLRYRVRACVRRLPKSSNPWIHLHSSSRAAICAEDIYLWRLHEQFNYYRTTMDVVLAPKETKSIIRSICIHSPLQNKIRYQERHLMWRPRIRRSKRAHTSTQRRVSCYPRGLSYKYPRLLIVA